MTYMAREPYANFWPKVADTAFVAESADLIGDVTIGEHASVWYHTTLRADINKIVIGDYSNIQDNSCIHLADDFGCYVGKYVTVGHGVILHACTVEDNCLIGMGSIILDGAVIGQGSVAGSGRAHYQRYRYSPQFPGAGFSCQGGEGPGAGIRG